MILSKKVKKVGSFMLRNNYFGETKTHYKINAVRIGLSWGFHYFRWD